MYNPHSYTTYTILHILYVIKALYSEKLWLMNLVIVHRLATRPGIVRTLKHNRTHVKQTWAKYI